MGLSWCGTRMARRSGIRSILQDSAAAASAAPGERWLNLGVGNPALIPEAITMWRRLTENALASSFVAASCQYGPSRGSDRLVNALADYFNRKYSWGVTGKNIVVGSGSQMLCFAAAALFAGPSPGGLKRIVLPFIPDYAGYHNLSLSADGVVGISRKVEFRDGRYFRYAMDYDALRLQPDIGLIILSSPCNPTGGGADANDVDALISIAEEQDCVVLIDHAYGAPFPQVAEALAPPVWHKNVINCFSISKAGLPGERIGFAIGAEHHVDAMVSFMANSALHAPQLPQVVLARALETGEIDYLAESVIRPYYSVKRSVAEKLLFENLPESVDWRLHTSQGGMFCWLWIRDSWFDDNSLYLLLKRKRVIIVPGRHFFVDPRRAEAHGTHCFRISIAGDEAATEEGIRRIAEGLEDLRCGYGR